MIILKMSRIFIEEEINSGMYFHDYGKSPVPAYNGFGVQHTMAAIRDAFNRMDCIIKRIKQGLTEEMRFPHVSIG